MDDEKMKPAIETKPNMVPVHDAYSALKSKEYSSSAPKYSDDAMKSVMDMYDPLLHGGVGLIAMERQRQINVERYTSGNDDHYKNADLAEAAICYAENAVKSSQGIATSYPRLWPWDAEFWKPSTPIRDLVKAGALIAAEIDRLMRAEKNAT